MINLNLPETLEYKGEFGSELIIFLPFVHWLSKEGLLKDKFIKTYQGMRCFYDDLDCKSIIEKSEARSFIPASNRPDFFPVKDEHSFDSYSKNVRHYYPDLRKKFNKIPIDKLLLDSVKPLLIIHNKYTEEWGNKPINYIPAETLAELFSKHKHRYTIVYIRHGNEKKGSGFSDDHNTNRYFPDQVILNAHPEVLSFDKVYESHVTQYGKVDINTFKNALYSRCFHFISVQGGGAHHIAMYSGSLMLILHHAGSELKWSYGNGYYGFSAGVPPVRIVCQSITELEVACTLLENTAISCDRVILDPFKVDLIKRFSPFRF
jgi:hypothetical protein